MGDGELKRLIQGFDLRKNGRVCFRELVEQVDPLAKDAGQRRQMENQQRQRGAGAGTDVARSGGNGSEAVGSDDGLLAMMRGVVREALQAGVSPRRAFERFDQDFDGIISAREFQAGLKAMMVGLSTSSPLSDADALALTRLFTAGKDA
jgi:Ca2+-binding EF-hand superfamily protein